MNFIKSLGIFVFLFFISQSAHALSLQGPTCPEKLPPLFKNLKRVVIYHEFSEEAARSNRLEKDEINRILNYYARELVGACIPDLKFITTEKFSQDMLNKDTLVYIVKSVFTKNHDAGISYEYRLASSIEKYRAGISEKETFSLAESTSKDFFYYNDRDDEIHQTKIKLGIKFGREFSQGLYVIPKAKKRKQGMLGPNGG